MRKSLIFTFTALFLLAGCTAQEPEKNYTHTLVISNKPILDYILYDKLDLSDLSVNERIYDGETMLSTQTITDYTLSCSAYDDVCDGMRLTKSGSAKITVSKEGCESASFSIYVEELDTELTENIIINSYPKTQYYIGDTFDVSGFEASLVTSYKYEGKTKKKTETLTDYSLTINGKDAEGYKFTDAEALSVTISSEGWDGKELSNVFEVSAIKKDSFSEKETDDSCTMEQDDKTMTVSFENSNKTLEEGDKGYYSPDEVVNGFTTNEFAQRNAYKWKYTPTTGKVPLLVIPVITPGDEYKATDENWNMIYKAFFGKSSDLHFESLRSYYYKSSFGQLDLCGGMTGYLDITQINSKYSSLSYLSTDTIDTLATQAAEWAEKNYDIDLTKYDSNHDGCIDGIWLINLHDTDSSQERFWGYTYSTFTLGTEEKPVANCYGWASVDFIDDSYSNTSHPDNRDCDAHVLIHETGHMMGLLDYYSYNDYTGNYDALGGFDMMDKNCGDHNPYSKLQLGWIKPYIVYGDAEINLKSCQNQNAVIVIPYDDKEYQKDENGKIIFNSYDEYLVLDLYDNLNLNEQGYDIYDSHTINGTGGRLYHADARLAVYSTSAMMLEDPDDCMDSYELIKPITNSYSGTSSESYYGLVGMDDCDEIRLIRADRKYSSATDKADTKALFNKNSTFALEDYSSQFNDGKLDCKHDFSASFTIDSIA